MRNINELVGIIKGINFDGIINQMEINRLQSWINKNRNLAYDKQQVGLIKLVLYASIIKQVSNNGSTVKFIFLKSTGLLFE